MIATAGEFVALYFWLHYYDRGAVALATIVLWSGFFTERIAVLYWVKQNFGPEVGIAAQSKPLWKKLLGLTLICLSEISIWMFYVFVYDQFGVAAGFVAIFLGEQLEHSVELGLLSQSSWKNFFFSRSATMITLLEALGGLAWLYLVRHGQPQLGGAMMLLGLTIEHVVQGNAIKRKLKGAGKAPSAPSPAAANGTQSGAIAQPAPTA